MNVEEFSSFSADKKLSDQKFIERTSYIILSKMEKGLSKLKNKFEGEICVGDWFSIQNYFRVKAINGNQIDVVNHRNIDMKMSRDILTPMYSA